MKNWLFALAPLLLLLAVPMEADAERLLLSGDGELQKRVTSSDTEIEVIFDASQGLKRTILELESGFMVLDGQKRFIMPQTEMRDFANNKIMRVSGVLDNGSIFWLYGLKNGESVEMFGTIFVGDNKYKLNFDTKLQNIDEPIREASKDPASILEYTPALDFDYRSEDPVFIQKDFQVQVKTFDSNISTGGLRNNLGSLGHVDIKVDLEQNVMETITRYGQSVEQVVEDEWELIHTFSGKTNEHGDYTGTKLLTSGVFEPKQFLRVTITATLDGQEVVKQYQLFVTEVGSK